MSAIATIRVANEPRGLAQARLACSQCNLRELCMPVGLNPVEARQLDHLVSGRRSLRKGETLFRLGEPFAAVYAIRLGTFKTRVGTPDGRDQVTGFQMAGELVGFDGICNGRHACDAVALEDAEVCLIPYARLGQLAQTLPAFQQHFHRLMSREIVREHGVMLLLGSMRAEERLAAFLLNLLERMRMRGYSGREIVLRMTREEIGSFLGLKLETVSRTLSRMAEEGLIEVRQRRVRIADQLRLRRLVEGGAAAAGR